MLRVLTSRREDLRKAQTARTNRLRDLLCSLHPGLEQQIDPQTKADVVLLTKYVTPAEIRRGGVRRIVAFLAKNGVRDKKAQALAEAAHAAAIEQHIAVRGEAVMADVVRELAAETLATRERIRLLDKQLEEALEDHIGDQITLSMPGMGVVLTAEFHAEVGDLSRFPSGDSLAAASAMAPTIRQSGKGRWLRRPVGGNRRLKRIFYQSAICALNNDPTSKTYYARKRSEGKTHRQAVIALARRRVNVLHAMLRSERRYDARYTAPAEAA